MRTEDGRLIRRCLDGEPEAFGFLVDRYRESVYAFAYSRLGNFHDAEDVTQEVFIKAYQKLRSLRRWDSFHAWISVRTFLNGYRIGYSKSDDGLIWSKIDFHDNGLLPRQFGYDSEETSFASIIQKPENKADLIMFYNGRNYGEDGLAVATGTFSNSW